MINTRQPRIKQINNAQQNKDLKATGKSQIVTARVMSSETKTTVTQNQGTPEKSDNKIQGFSTKYLITNLFSE